MKPLIYSTEVDAELADAVDYYDGQKDGLGRRFFLAYLRTLDRIRENPSTGWISAVGTRTQSVERFPYGIVFREAADHIYVAAVCHFSRRENYWIDRI